MEKYLLVAYKKHLKNSNGFSKSALRKLLKRVKISELKPVIVNPSLNAVDSPYCMSFHPCSTDVVVVGGYNSTATLNLTEGILSDTKKVTFITHFDRSACYLGHGVQLIMQSIA